ncbi:hypothetical protein QP028_16110 [Corynebacterium suedekumii]|nr:hypothetical protein QP028_16110 [Corynebacterium suedekumii]
MTTPRITVLQPDPTASLDRFTDWLTEAGAAVDVVDLTATDVPETVGDGVIVLGGINDARSYPWVGDLHAALRDWVSAGIPVLGICLGAQLLADAHDGDLDFGLEGEEGAVEVELMEAASSSASSPRWWSRNTTTTSSPRSRPERNSWQPRNATRSRPCASAPPWASSSTPRPPPRP